MLIQELDTPAVVVDIDVLEGNLSRMASYCRVQGLNLRPHTKTHKIPELAVASIEDCALSVIVTVVSTGSSGRAIIDGGSKTFSSGRYLAGDGRGFGLVREARMQRSKPYLRSTEF